MAGPGKIKKTERLAGMMQASLSVFKAFDVKDGFEPSYRVLPTHTSPLGHLTFYIIYQI
jgi:hypothetical protein